MPRRPDDRSAESATICKRAGGAAARCSSRHLCSGLFPGCFSIDLEERGHCSLCIAQDRRYVGQIVTFVPPGRSRMGSPPLYFHCCLQWRLSICCSAARRPVRLRWQAGNSLEYCFPGRDPQPVGVAPAASELTGIYRETAEWCALWTCRPPAPPPRARRHGLEFFR
jgi:hypothetical protein